MALLSSIKKWAKRKVNFKDSASYWKERYRSGGNSGRGSYNKLAEFKASVINGFVKEHEIIQVIEFGCGDGNQLGLYDFPTYVGYDVSEVAVSKCQTIFKDDKTKVFKLLKEYDEIKADLVISIDVIHHLIEDEIFEDHINKLFNASNNYIIIYTSDEEIYNPIAPHVRHRNFTRFINEKYPQVSLMRHIQNKYPYNPHDNETTRADFFIYKIV